VTYPKLEKEIEGEAEFLEQLDREDFNREEKMDMIKDFAEIAALKSDNALPGVIKEKQKALEAKIVFTKRQKRL
jgi:hypothetical protein